MIAARPSPLLLVHKVVPKLRLEAMQGFSGQMDIAYSDAPITVRQGIRWLDDHGFWGVDVAVECWPADDVLLPYRFEIATFGAFRVQPGVVPEEQHEVFVAVNGSGVLYSWIRELVRANTAVGPYGAVELPLLFFPRPAPEVNPQA